MCVRVCVCAWQCTVAKINFLPIYFYAFRESALTQVIGRDTNWSKYAIGQLGWAFTISGKLHWLSMLMFLFKEGQTAILLFRL